MTPDSTPYATSADDPAGRPNPTTTHSRGRDGQPCPSGWAQTYVLGSILCYGMFMGALFLVLRLFGATHSMDAFIDTQFNYHSPWRQIIVGFMTVNMFLYWAHRSLWLASGMFIFPAYLTCVVAQIVLFFKHLY